MPQSLARLTVHLVFSTKCREPLITDVVRPDLHAYMAGILRNVACPAVVINSVEDHVHILFRLARTVALSTVVEQVKKSSSKWIKTHGEQFSSFAWQSGYGAFAVSESDVQVVQRYIELQREHHQGSTFEDEYLGFMYDYQVDFDQRFMWEWCPIASDGSRCVAWVVCRIAPKAHNNLSPGQRPGKQGVPGPSANPQ